MKFKNTAKLFLEKLFITTLLVAVFFFCIPGFELFPNANNIFKSKNAEAAIDYGRETRTAEFLLSMGTDTATRTTAVLSYTSAAGWVTSRPALSSGDLIKLFGKNIHVDSAQLEVSYYATAVAVSRQDIFLEVEKSSTEGTLVAAGEYIGMSANTLNTGGLTGSILTMHDVTSFFDRQSSVDFESGINVVAGLNVVGPTRFLTSMKITMTYSVDVETTSHTLIKTVKLPLLSATNRGTRNAACAVSATCAFTFDLSKIPDLTNKAQIESMSVEINTQEGATAVADSLTLRMTGSAATTQYYFADTYTDAYAVRILWNPVSDAQFTLGGIESIDVVNGTTALYALGGEVTLTYTYDSNTPIQTETVKYFVSQGTTLPTNVLQQLSTSTVNIVNTNAEIKTAWYRASVSPSLATANITFGHRINSTKGNSTSTNITYALNTANVRAANTPTLFHVLDESAGVYSTSTNLSGSYQYSSATAGATPVSVSAYITFTWDFSDALLPRTKTVMFGASQKGPTRNVAGSMKTSRAMIVLSEHSEKKSESVFVETDYLRFDTTSITGSGNFVTRIGQQVITIAEGGIVEPHRKRILTNIPQSDFFGASTSSAQYFPFTIAQYYSGADYSYQANSIFVTYSTPFSIKQDAVAKQSRTVEFILGGGTDVTARAAGSNQYFGDGTIGAAPSMLPIQILGKSIRVTSAYIDVSYMMAVSAAAQTSNDILITGAITGYGGSKSDVYFNENAGSQHFSNPSGITGYYHGQHDVTALFANQYDDGYWNRGDVQTLFGITTNQSTGNRTMTNMKLVLTYESDFDLVWHDEIKTVKIPLQSSDSLGTRAASCAMATNCLFTYSRSLPDLVDVVSAHFEMRANIDGSTNSSIYMASNGAQSASIFPNETSNDSTAMRYLWQIPIANLNATTSQGQTGTLTFRNESASALNMYGVGGELVITYKYNTGSTKQLETISYPIGQQATAAFAKTSIGTSTPYISNKGASVRDAWIRYYSAPYATGNITVYGKLGTSTERSIVMTNTVASRSGGERVYYLNLTQDAVNFNMPTTSINASIAFTSGAQYPTGAEVLLNYVWDGSLYGTTTKTLSFPSAQHSATNVSGNAPQVKQTLLSLPQNVSKVFRGAYSRTMFQHSSAGTYGGTFALGPAINFGINNSTTSITNAGDAYAFNSILIKEYSESTLFGSIASSSLNYVRFENSAQSANPFRFSNEVMITYDELQEERRATFTQDAFRIFMNSDSNDVTDFWHTSINPPLGESQAMTASNRPVRKSDVVRLRLGLTVGTSTLNALSQAFQLQSGKKTTSCNAIDVDWQNVTSGNEWVGHDNPSVASGITLPSLKLSESDILGTYSETGATGLNPNQVNIGQIVEYDFVIKRDTATSNSDYCFRVVEQSGKKIAGYQFYPIIRTAGYTPETTNWRWYDDELNETPADNPLWIQNGTALSVSNNNIIKLRIGLLEVANEAGSNERFALQYSSDPTFGTGVQFVNSISACNINSVFCYADSPSAGDDDDSVLSTSKFGILRGRHNESTSTSTFSPAALSHYEMEYSIKPVRQRTGQVYYFRLYDTKNDSVIFVNGSNVYPSSQAEGATLEVSVSGIPRNTLIAGNLTTSDTTSNTLPFGFLSPESSLFLSQLLNIRTNAVDGYMVSVLAKDDMRNEDGDIIPALSAENLTPLTWNPTCSPWGNGCIGYHTTDLTLNPVNNTARFSADDTWAGISSTTPGEIAYSSNPTDVSGDDINIVYRAIAGSGTGAGEYSTDIVYVVTPVY